jgi:broad specificity phosphatase PhoE
MIMKPFHAFFAVTVLTAIMVCSCASTDAGRARDLDETIFVIVRHAEKATDDPKDPALSDAGHARAAQLAERLKNQRLGAIYATRYRRTQQTASPTAAANNLDVQTYDAAMPAADFALRLRRKHTADTVLVIGHSNTVSLIAGALCACTVSPLREDEYDRWITIRIDRNGDRTIKETRY